MIPKVDFNVTKPVTKSDVEVHVQHVVKDVNNVPIPPKALLNDYEIGNYVDELLEGSEDE